MPKHPRPLVLLTYLRFLLWREIIHDVELLPDLFRGLPLNHGRNLRASQIEEGLDVQVVGCEDELEQDLLLDVDVLDVPLPHAAFREVRRLERLLDLRRWLVLMELGVVEDLPKDCRLDVRKR